MKKDKEIHKESAKGLKPKAELKVYWEIKTMKEGDFYEDDDGHECQASPTWTKRIDIQEITFKDAVTIFKREDGDYDHSATILFITDMKGKVLYDSRFKVATYTNKWTLYNKFKDEKDPYLKSKYGEDLFKAIQSENEYRCRDRYRRQKHFIESMKYQSEHGEGE